MDCLTCVDVPPPEAPAMASDAPPNMPRVHVMDVIRIAAERGGLTLDEITGPRRFQRFARWRQRAMYVARDLCGASYPKLAQRFNRDHTTALFAYRKLSAACAVDADERRLCADLAEAAIERAARQSWRTQAQTDVQPSGAALLEAAP